MMNFLIASQPSTPSRTYYMPTNTGSEQIQQSIYEDPDALLPATIDADQPEAQGKPIPAPRTRSQQKNQQNSTSNYTDSLQGTENKTTAGPHNGYLRPSCPPPRPPVNSQKHTETARGSSQRPNARSPAEPPAENTRDKPPPPPRPKHIPEISPYHERLPYSISQRYEAADSTNRPSVQPHTNRRGNLLSQNITPPPPFKPPFPSPVTSDEGSVHTEICDHQYLEILPVDSDEMDMTGLLRWFKRISNSDYMGVSVYGLSNEGEIRSFNQRAINFTKARRLYSLLMMKRKEGLQNIITEFKSICKQLDKIKKKNKTMGIAGGTTGAVGGAAAVVGIALAPLTMGTSLIATAVGAGMIASAGGMGAHAAKASKKMVTRTTIDELVNTYRDNAVDLERCLDFILSTMNELRRYDIARLESKGVDTTAAKMANNLCNVLRNNAKNCGETSAQLGGVASERLLQAFTKEMDQFFTEKHGQKLNKSNKSRFGGRLCLLADGLQEGLNHLNDMWENFS